MLKPIELKNGINILRLPKTGSKVTTVGFVVNTGTANEKDQYPTGITKLVEALFWSGTNKHPSRKSLNTYLESIGGSFESVTSYELVQFYITVPRKNQYKAISFLAEVIQDSLFDYRQLERQKQIIIEELKNEDVNYSNEINELGLSNIYENYGLGQTQSGSIDTILSIRQQDILDLLSNQFTTDKCYVILSGDFDTRPATELVTQEWSLWNPKKGEYKELGSFDVSQLELPKVMYKHRGINQTQINVGFALDRGMNIISNYTENENGKLIEEFLEIEPAQAQNDLLTNWAEFLVLNTVLGSGYSSRLWSKSVEEEMYFYEVSSSLLQFSRSASLEISGLADNTHFTFALESILSVINSLKQTTVSINELAKAKEFLKGKMILEQEDGLSFVTWQIENLLSSGLTFTLEDLLEKIDLVEARGLRMLAESLFVPERLYITTFGPAKETRLVEKLIRKHIGAFDGGNL